MSFLDYLFGGLRLWRRLRGGRWLDLFHIPSACCVGWVRAEWPRNQGEYVCAVEDYTLPRARVLP